MTYKVFTYGTLMKGQRNHFYLADSEYLGEATLDGYVLYDTGYGYPAAVARQGSKIHGELYEVDEKTKASMDRLESVGYLYDCKAVAVVRDDHEEEALFYVYLQDVSEMEVWELPGKWHDAY